MSGVKPLFLLYAFMAWTGEVLPLPVSHFLFIFILIDSYHVKNLN
jgi:hypothetical protein